MAHFEVGRKCIALIDHPKGRFKKYDIFPVLDLKLSRCACNGARINIGLHATSDAWMCVVCQEWGDIDDGYLWQKASDFAPYDDSLSELTVEHILNEQTVQI